MAEHKKTLVERLFAADVQLGLGKVRGKNRNAQMTARLQYDRHGEID
jgi:hypothetical protein